MTLNQIPAAAISRIAPPTVGVRRRCRRLLWSLGRRVAGARTVELAFDHDLRIRVRLDERLGRKIYLDRYSDREHAQLLHHLLHPGMVYFDIGAHVGQFTLMAARRVGHAGQVHAFEATREVFEQLVRNVHLNGFENIHPNHAAVFDRAGMVELMTCAPGKAAFNAVGRPLRPDDQVIGSQNVPSLRMDDYCRERNISRIDFVKIDVNGPELHVIRGFGSLLEGSQAPSLVCEFNDLTTAPLGYTTLEMRRHLEGLGYSLYTFDPDAVAIRPEPLAHRYEHTVNLLAIKDAGRFQSLLAGASL